MKHLNHNGDAALPCLTALATGAIHLVHVRLDEPLDGAVDLLDDTERARAARFAFEDDRRRFVVAHAWARIALARGLACAPQSLRFAVGPRGKPRVENVHVDVRFNLSHAAERALIALTVGREV